MVVISMQVPTLMCGYKAHDNIILKVVKMVKFPYKHDISKAVNHLVHQVKQKGDFITIVHE